MNRSAPEIMAQNTNYDASADIYSIGILALELFYSILDFEIDIL
jgi:serine/threonine protein kinase